MEKGVGMKLLCAIDGSRIPSGHYSREFVTKPLRRQARRACGVWGLTPFPRLRVVSVPIRTGTGTVADDGASPQQYVDRLSGEPARRQACRSGVSAVAAEVFVSNAS